MTTFGSFCSGAEMLGMGIEAVLGPLNHLWHAEIDPAASKVLEHRHPDVPNLGDITTADWTAVPPADVLAAGFPCTDVSGAGLRLGLRSGTRTGIWLNIAVAIEVLRPRLVLLENVEGLHSAKADSDVEPCPWCVGDPVDESVLRASGAVCGHLAQLGYDARWITVPASDVGAPHRRKRVFIAAYPADTESLRHWIAGPEGGQGIPATTAGGAVRPDGVSSTPTPRAAGGSSGTETVTLLPTPRVTDGTGAGQHGTGGLDLRTAVSLLPTPKSRDHKSPGPSEADRNSPALSAITLLLPTPRATDGTKGGPNQRGSSGDLMLPSAVMLLPTPTAVHWARNATADRTAVKADTNDAGWTLADVAFADRWGEYAPAIARWEQVIGRPAPEPTEPGTKGQPRLAPRFVEWMMGLPDGWVCDVPGTSRNDQLRILGNGVVWQQAAYAYRYLLNL